MACQILLQRKLFLWFLEFLVGIQLTIPPPSSLQLCTHPSQHILPPLFMLCSYTLSQVSVIHLCISVGLSTGAWESHYWLSF